jgi:sugar O-acyltransferase (sialic acid O-acetyltransferase NeuD family)
MARAARMVFGLYGAGGFAREVMPIVGEHIPIMTQSNTGTSHQTYFIENLPRFKEVNGYPLISDKGFFEIECTGRFFNIAISDSKVRERIAKKSISKGAKPFSIQSRHSVVYDRNEIGEGTILCAHTTITSNVKIGNFVHLNIYSYVAHDCVIGDYVTFGPNVHCNGNVHIKNHVYVGTGAVIKQGSLSKPLIIGEGAVIGMGAVVTKNVPPFTVVVGNPAKPHKKIKLL